MVLMPSNRGWCAELECRPGDGRVVFTGVQKAGPAFEAGIQPGDVLVQVETKAIRSRDLELACDTIWRAKALCKASGRPNVSLLVIPRAVDCGRRAVKPIRGRGDPRRHGLGEQGLGTSVLTSGGARARRKHVRGRALDHLETDHMESNELVGERLEIGLNRVLLPTKRGHDKWGLRLIQDPAEGSISVEHLAKTGAGKQKGIRRGDVLLALVMSGKSSAEASSHVLLSKCGGLKLAKEAIQIAKGAAQDNRVPLEVVVYRPPPVNVEMWLPRSDLGLGLAVQDGHTVISKVNPEGSAFDQGVDVGDVLVAVDNIVMSSPSISLGEARDRLMDAKDFARDQHRRVLLFRFYRAKGGRGKVFRPRR
jgi:hypothetical protein